MSEPSRRPDVSAVSVQFSSVEDARRLVFLALETVVADNVKRSKAASVLAAKLRDAGLLGECVEQYYSAADAARLMGCRTSAWAVQHARAGDFGPVACDGGDWLIPASGLLRYLARHGYDSAEVAERKKSAATTNGSEGVTA